MSSYFRPLFLFNVWVLNILLTLPVSAADQALSEEKAKAALLYNFIKHSGWPDEANKEAFKVVFWGEKSNFYDVFKDVTQKALVREKPIRMQRSSDLKVAAAADVVVVCKLDTDQLEQLASQLTQTQTLLVSDNAQNNSSVMINFTYPKSTKLSFEVNKSNIVFEGLSLSKDILLYGGSEIDVATLYKEMEKNLLVSKRRLLKREAKLQEQQQLLDQQRETLQKQSTLVAEKNEKIAQQSKNISIQQRNIDNLNQEQSEIQALLNASAQQLSLSRSRVLGAEEQLLESRKLSSQLSDQINKNAQILSEQNEQVNQQAEKISSQTIQLGTQQGTISHQRNIIFIALCALSLLLIYIVYRQKQALGKERALSEAKAELVKSQEASIDAYKSSLQVKNDFLTAINHELRTPMHLITGALHDISSEDESSLQQSLGIVEHGAEQMMTLIADILFYSELQSDQVSIHSSAVNIKYQLQEACEFHRAEAEEKNLGFYVHFSRSVPDYVTVDAERLCMIVEKLLDNAIRFTDQGEVVINVDWDIRSDAGPLLLIQINDTGKGFSPEALENVFKPFEQEDNGLTRQHQGLGIGLSMCDKLLNLMQGSIKVSSDQHKGTSIDVQLPAAHAMQPGHEVKPKLSLAVDNTRQADLILVVEDNPVSQLVIEKVLLRLGYRCTKVDCADQALAIIDELKPALIIMDVQMPDMSGIECTRIHRQQVDCHQPPIIALTANPTELVHEDCIKAGMDAVLTKPIDVPALKERLTQLLQPTHGSKEL